MTALAASTEGFQALLVGGSVDVQTRLIRRRKDFDALFDGSFTELRGVAYVASPSVLADLLESKGYSKVRFVIGENLAAEYKRDAAAQPPEALAKLVERVADGRLQILVPKRTQHSKLYVLLGSSMARIIQGSPNLTETARSASKQLNYVWFADLPLKHPFVERVLADFEDHCGDCTLFMGDLLELMKDTTPDQREETIRAWLSSTDEADPTIEATVDIVDSAVEASLENRPVITMALPSAGTRRTAEKLLGSGFSSDGAQARVDVGPALANIKDIIGLPYMTIRNKGVVIAAGSVAERLSEPPTDPVAVDRALENIEAYCETVDLGQAGNPAMVKASFFEVILYILTAPFFHLWMKSHRQAFGNVNRRGPRALYVFGTSHNGKSTLLQFGLRLLAGADVRPLEGKDFTKTKVAGARQSGTLFPLAFDDLMGITNPSFETILKSYWESWWGPERPMAQLIFTSNNPRLKEWASTRMKRINLSIHFPPNPDSQRRLSQLFEFDNRIFRWFSHRYLEAWRGEISQEDELATARAVMQGLYEFAGRKLPPYFPTSPIEKVYEPGREAWRDLMFETKKASKRWSRDRLLVTFDDDVTDIEVLAYQSQLAPHINQTKTGRTLTIENPEDFLAWLGRPRRRAGNLWGLVRA